MRTERRPKNRRALIAATVVVGIASLVPVAGVPAGAVPDQEGTGGGGDGHANEPPSRPIRWAALGDSYSSGEGLDDTEGPCHQSRRAYPLRARTILEGAGWEFDDLDFLACSGAHLTPPDDEDDEVQHMDDQLAALDGRYDLVTLTIGGNDAGYSEVMRSCVLPNENTPQTGIGCMRLLRDWNTYHELRNTNPQVSATLDARALALLKVVETYEDVGASPQAAVARDAFELYLTQLTCYDLVDGELDEEHGYTCNSASDARDFDLSSDEYLRLVMDEFERQLVNRMDLATLGAELQERLSEIRRSHLTPGGHIVVLGYPYLFEHPDNWSGVDRLARTCGMFQASFVKSFRFAAAALDDRIDEMASTEDAATFLPVADSFEGHNLCARDGEDAEWINGLTLGLRLDWPVAHPEASLHPNLDGYEALAGLLVAHVRGLDWRNLHEGGTAVARHDGIDVHPASGDRTPVELDLGAPPDGQSAVDVLGQALGPPTFELPPWPETDRTPPECWEDGYRISVWTTDDGAPYFAALDTTTATTSNGRSVQSGVLLGYRAYQPAGSLDFSDRVGLGDDLGDLRDAYTAGRDDVLYTDAQFGEEVDGGVAYELVPVEVPDITVAMDLPVTGPELGILTGQDEDDTIVERGAGVDGQQCGLDLVADAVEAGIPTDDDGDGGGGAPGGDPDAACGLRVGIVLDRSPSITDAGGEGQVRSAATGLVDALGGTGAEVRISAFSGSPASLTSGWVPLLEPSGRRVARQAVANMAFTGSGTNWESALDDLSGQQADIVVLVTDGLPNEYGVGISGQQSADGTSDFDPVALSAGVAAADGLRSDGARIVGVGVGDVRADSLAQVAGPTEGEDYYVGDFASLGASLAEVATDICGTALTVQHRVDGVPTGDAEYTFRVGGDEAQTATTGADGVAHLALDPDAGGSVTVQGPADMRLMGITCERGGDDAGAEIDEATASATVDIAGGPVTCTYDWQSLVGADIVADVLNGPGTVRILSFEPRQDSADVVGCIGAGDHPNDCSAGRFGVSFDSGFAVIRFDASCAGCPDPGTLAVTGDGDSIRFQLDAGRGLGTTDHLDVTVHPVYQADVQVSGSVHANDMVNVDVVSAASEPCLAHVPAGGRGNRRISTGVGC
jgi:von Willebrand factor type A domain-containing protein